jgi:hypothetical protein
MTLHCDFVCVTTCCSDEESYDEYGAPLAASPAAVNGALPAAEGDTRTGLGVAGVLRRLRLWAREHSEQGLIVLEAKELTRWCKTTARWVRPAWVGRAPLSTRQLLRLCLGS